MNQQAETDGQSADAGTKPVALPQHPKTTKPPYYHPDTKTYQEEVGRFLHRRMLRNLAAAARFSYKYNGIITAISTLIMAVFTALLFDVSQQQAKILSSQLNSMQNEQRPWIKIKVFVKDFLDLTSGWGVVPVNYTVTNFGKSPAFRVKIGAWPYLGLPWSDGFFEFQKMQCERFVRSPNRNFDQQWTVFPNEDRTWNGVHGLPDPGYSPSDLKKVMQEDSKGGKTVRITFAGCVDYVSPDDGQHHQTAFSFEVDELVMSLGELARTPLVSIEHRIPADKLLLEAYPSPPELTN